MKSALYLSLLFSVELRTAASSTQLVLQAV
jgi:hypothetical protein